MFIGTPSTVVWPVRSLVSLTKFSEICDMHELVWFAVSVRLSDYLVIVMRLRRDHPIQVRGLVS